MHFLYQNLYKVTLIRKAIVYVSVIRRGSATTGVMSASDEEETDYGD
jgi:hypothetical protein